MSDKNNDEHLLAQLSAWGDQLAADVAPFEAGDLGQPVVVPLAGRRTRWNPLILSVAAAVVAASALAAVAWRPWSDESSHIAPAESTTPTAPDTVLPSTSVVPTETSVVPTETSVVPTETSVPSVKTPSTDVLTTEELVGPTTVPLLTGPAVISNGEFLGIRSGSRRADRVTALEQFGLPITGDALPAAHLCGVGLPYSEVMTVGGLSLLWEGQAAEDAVLTNWWYSGYEIDGRQQMATAEGTTVGDTLAQVMLAYPTESPQLDDTMLLPGYRIEITAGVVTGIGQVDCGD